MNENNLGLLEMELNNSKKDLHHRNLQLEEMTNTIWDLLVLLLKTLFIYTTGSICFAKRVVEIINLKIKIFVLDKKIKNG